MDTSLIHKSNLVNIVSLKLYFSFLDFPLSSQFENQCSSKLVLLMITSFMFIEVYGVEGYRRTSHK